MRMGRSLARQKPHGTSAKSVVRAETTARQLTAFVRNSEDAIYSTELDGIITDWNPAAEGAEFAHPYPLG